MHCKDFMLLDIYFQIKENKNILPQIHKITYLQCCETVLHTCKLCLFFNFFYDNLVYGTLNK